MFFTSKIFSNEIPHGAPVFKKGRQNRHSSGRMGTGPPLVPWHLPECPIEPSGPQIPVCHQPCPALTFYEATSKNPGSSQKPFFLFLVFPATSMGAASQHLWSWCTGESSRTCHTGWAHPPSHPQFPLQHPGSPAWSTDTFDFQTLFLSLAR